MTKRSTRIDARGRITIPAALRRAIGLEPGATAVLTSDGPELRVVSLTERIRRAQELVRRYVPATRQLSRELISERRGEARSSRGPS
ncbi:MAG: AbrB/MazE/SpoVT family DNA-binding domain-containing protein [Thermoanaerobaculia bacterium]